MASFRTAYFADLAKRYDEAQQVLNVTDSDGDDWGPRERVFDALRDAAFAFRPTSMDEVADKATFLASRWDDADGMNPERFRQLFCSLGAVPA